MNERLTQLIAILDSTGSPQQRLSKLVNDEFHAQIDQNGFLQIQPADLTLKISPLSPFFVKVRQLVIDAYPTSQGLKADELGRKLHLFRSYLDLFYLNYIRQYPGQTDYQRLLSFAREHNIRLDYETDSGYHNRTRDKYTYPRNMKVQLVRNSWRFRESPARMIEFVVDIDRGEFVSEWNAYRLTEMGRVDSNPENYSIAELESIANTESFNYGIPHGNYFVYPHLRKTHYFLDVQQPQDSLLRQLAKKVYRSPKGYRSGGSFADLIKAGGIKDAKAWQRVPLSRRAEVYLSFIEHLTHSKMPNWGINYYLGSTMRYQQYFMV